VDDMEKWKLLILWGLEIELYPSSDPACRRSYCPLLRIEGVAWSAQRILKAVNFGFIDPEPLLSIQVAPQLYLRGCGPRSRPTTSQKIW
jgi:hypothetical protein